MFEKYGRCKLCNRITHKTLHFDLQVERYYEQSECIVCRYKERRNLTDIEVYRLKQKRLKIT